MDPQAFLPQQYSNPPPPPSAAAASMEVLPNASVLLHLANPQLMNHNSSSNYSNNNNNSSSSNNNNNNIIIINNNNNNNNNSSSNSSSSSSRKEEEGEGIKEGGGHHHQHPHPHREHFGSVNGVVDADLGQMRISNLLAAPEARSKWDRDSSNSEISCARAGDIVANHHHHHHHHHHHQVPWTSTGADEGHCYNGVLLESLTEYMHYNTTGQLLPHHIGLPQYPHNRDAPSSCSSPSLTIPNGNSALNPPPHPTTIDAIPSSIAEMPGTMDANPRFSRAAAVGELNIHPESFVSDRAMLFAHRNSDPTEDINSLVPKSCSLPEPNSFNDHHHQHHHPPPPPHQMDHPNVVASALQTPRKKNSLDVKVGTSSLNDSDESNMGTQDVSSSCEKANNNNHGNNNGNNNNNNNNSNGRPAGRKRKAGGLKRKPIEEEERESLPIQPKDVPEADEPGKPKRKKGDETGTFSCVDGDQHTKTEQCSTSVNSGESTPKSTKENSIRPQDIAPKQDFIHVRARRGQATDSHSLAERVRREKISERMKYLQDLVPGCSKVTGKAVMLDEIINYVQSLQRQVEFLSMKLAVMNPRVAEVSMEAVFGHERNVEPSRTVPSAIRFGQENEVPYHNLHAAQHDNGAFIGPHPLPPYLTAAAAQTALDAYGNSLSQGWDIGELQSVVQSGFQGQLFPGQMKAEH